MNIIIYVDKNCSFCKEQLRILKKNKIKAIIKDASQMPNILKGKKGETSVPKIVFVHTGVLDFAKIKNNVNKRTVPKKKKLTIIAKRKKSKKNIYNFGMSEISLRQYGKNYIPELKLGGYTAQNDFYNKDLSYYSSNNIRMNRPGGPEDYFNNLNYNCNLVEKKKPEGMEYGLYPDSKGPFKFGLTPYGGGKNKDQIDYSVIKKNQTFINNNATSYFGKKKVIKEGTVLTVKRKKNGKAKIKVKN